MARDDKTGRPPVEDEFFQGESAHEAGAEGGMEEGMQDDWQSEQPMDDFEDGEEGSHEESHGASMEDDFVQHGEDPAAHAEAQAAGAADRTKENGGGAMAGPIAMVIKALPIVIGVVVVGLLGFLGYQQFAGKPDAPAAGDQMAAQTNTLSMTPPSNSVANNASNQQGQQMQPMATPASPSMPSSMITPAAAPAAENNAMLEGKIADLSHELDALKQSNNQLEQQLRAVQQAPAPAPAQPQPQPQPQPDPAALQKISQLEDKIAQLEQKLGTPPPAPASVLPATKEAHKDAAATQLLPLDREGAQSAAGDKKAERPSSDYRKRHHRHGMGAARALRRDSEARRLQREENSRMGGSSGGVPNAPDVIPVLEPQGSGSWLLRSAQPGSAWLSQGMSTDLRRVVPGDKVQGLGTITSIRQIAGRWVVEGTQGSVR